METNGFEPMAYCLQSNRSTNWAMPPVKRLEAESNRYVKDLQSLRTTIVPSNHYN